MKINCIFKAIASWMLVLFVFWGGMLYSQPRQFDVQYMGANGEIVNGIRCGTVAPDEARREQLRQQIEDWLQSGNFSAPTTTITIPVAFHIVRHDNGFGDVTDQQITDQLDVLNSSYASSNFQYSLHSIERVNNTAWSTHYPGDPEEAQMKQALAIDPAHVLNFYTCDLGGGLLGYSTFPWSYPEDSYMHGVVVLYASLPGGSAYPYNEGDTGTHEVGHFVGLYHTFQGGCTSPGDEVDDTPYQNDGNNVYVCDPNLDTCPQSGTDPVDNFMNYTDDPCMDHFTPGQGNRMDEQMAFYRPSMYNPQIEVVVDQLLSDGQTTIGTIGRWDGVDFLPRFSPPDTFNFAINSTEVFHGDTNIYSNEKYNRWNDDPDVVNHHVFTITSDLSELTSNFNPTKPGITIRNHLLSASDKEGGTIDFKDPWFIDYPDPAYGNNLRNRGMKQTGPDSLRFWERSSPFNPNTNPSGPGSEYKGVFLDQPFTGNNPHYSVRARQKPIIPFHGEDITWYFQGWEGTDVQFEHANQTETAVVFKQDSAVAQANYKGHLASDTEDATAGNNSRKIIADNFGNLYMVYIEDGKLYFTESSDGGDHWDEEILLDGSNQYECLNPSVGVDRNPVVHIVYERKSFDVWTDYRVIYKKRDMNGTWQTVDLSGDNHLGFNEPTTPSINVGYYEDVYVAWRYSQMQGATGGLVLRTIDYYGNQNPEWSSYLYVPETDLSSYLPSCGFPANESFPTNNIVLTWRQESKDDILYISGGYENNNWQWSSTMSLAGDISYLARNDRPSIYQGNGYHNYNTYVVWQGIKGLSPEKSRQGNERPPTVCIREKDSNGWLPMEIFIVENTLDRNPVVTAFNYEEGEDYGIAYQESEREVRYFTRPDGSNYEQTLSGDGVNPAITTTLDEIPFACWTEYHTPPYLLKHASLEIEEKRSGGEEIPHRRILSFNLQDALSGSHLLNMNADLSLEMADPEIVTPLGNQKLKFSFSHSTLNTQNAFSLQPYLVNKANSRLRIPVNILVQNFTVNEKNRGTGNDLPFWNLRIRNAATNRVLAVVHSYNTGHLTGHHSSNFVLSDTFEVDLSNYLGKNIQLEGVTYLLKNAPHVGLAELYDLRRTAPLEKRTLTVKKTQMLPAAYHLYQNYPNPFNPTTTISFDLTEENRVRLTIYDITGRKIRTLAEGRYPVGTHKIVWDGRDSRGQAVASGVYAYRLQAGKQVTTRKLLLMK